MITENLSLKPRCEPITTLSCLLGHARTLSLRKNAFLASAVCARVLFCSVHFMDSIDLAAKGQKKVHAPSLTKLFFPLLSCHFSPLPVANVPGQEQGAGRNAIKTPTRSCRFHFHFRFRVRSRSRSSTKRFHCTRSRIHTCRFDSSFIKTATRSFG